MIGLRQKIGQMLMMGFSGCSVSEESDVATWIKKEGLGGVLLFDKDLATKTAGKNLKDCGQIQLLTSQLQACAQEGLNQDIQSPLLIALDYEGGAVDRLKNIPDCNPTLTPKEQATLDPTALYQEANIMATTLQNLGFNLNFAPVLDLNIEKKEGIIGSLGRSFSRSPQVVTRTAETFVRAFKEAGVMCCYKHFPGHGSATGDTHESFVDVTDTYHPEELEPYRDLIKNKDLPAMIMTAHVINRKLDHSGMPATLSYSILTDLLRHKLGFEGIIISDDLQMRALSSHFTIDEILALTINAGADMLIVANQIDYISANEIIDKIEHLVLSGEIHPSRIEQSYQRILQFKNHLAVVAA